MARERRVLRLQQLILEVAAEAMQREGRDARLDLVTLTRVKLVPDLSAATIWWSCLAKEKGREKTEEALKGILPLMQRAVAKGLRTRITPILDLRFDPTLENAQRLDDIFHKLAEERGDLDDDGGDEDEDIHADPAEEPAGPTSS